MKGHMNKNNDGYPLLPCPFCGSPAKMTGECDMVWAVCTNNECRVERICKFDEPEDAVKDWNNRMTLPVNDLIEYCKQAADTVQGLVERTLEASKLNARHLDAVAWFMQKEELYRYILPGIIRELAKRED